MSHNLLFPSTFFFSHSAAHRDLHSFPTRRSSDLPRCCRARDRRTRQSGGPDRRGRLPHTPVSRSVGTPALASTRSEEHTSELQSPVHLVCRLLLEKKKKTNVCPCPESRRLIALHY